MNLLETKIENMKNTEIKEAMFLMAPKKLSAHEQLVYGMMFDELEKRLCEKEFDSFLDQVDEQITKGKA